MISSYFRFNNLRRWLYTSSARKLGIWLALSLAFSVVFFRDFWTSLPALLSPDYVFDFHTGPWGVLCLCIAFLVWKKRRLDLNAGSRTRNGESPAAFHASSIITGLALLAGGIALPYSSDFLTSKVLLGSLAAFVMVFGIGAARIPAILTAIYGFSVAFPIVIERFAQEAYSRLDIVPLMALMDFMHYPIHIQGQVISFSSTAGEPISVTLTAACAGPASMAVFIALFALMTLDNPLPPRRAVWVFLVGAAGTWFQSLLRVFILMVLGYNIGSSALWTAHYWTIYILFPLWYLVFALVYFWQLREVSRDGKTRQGSGFRPPESGGLGP